MGLQCTFILLNGFLSGSAYFSNPVNTYSYQPYYNDASFSHLVANKGHVRFANLAGLSSNCIPSEHLYSFSLRHHFPEGGGGEGAVEGLREVCTFIHFRFHEGLNPYPPPHNQVRNHDHLTTCGIVYPMDSRARTKKAKI